MENGLGGLCRNRGLLPGNQVGDEVSVTEVECGAGLRCSGSSADVTGDRQPQQVPRD